LEKGQLSLEIVIIVTIIIGLSLMIGAKALDQQEGVFNDATVRQIVIGELAKAEGQYTLYKVMTEQCETIDKISISLDIRPEPKSRLKSAIARAIIKSFSTGTLIENFDGTGTICPS